MSKKKAATNRKLQQLKDCYKSYKQYLKALKTKNDEKILAAKQKHKQNCAKLQTKKR